MPTYPPMMPSEVFRFWVGGLLSLLALMAVIAGYLWQRKRSPSRPLVLTCGVAVLGVALLMDVELRQTGQDVSTVFSGPYLIVTLGSALILGRNLIHRERTITDVSWTVLLFLWALWCISPQMAHRGDAVWRFHCKHNLRQIGFEIWRLSERDGISPVTGDPPMSWRVSLLPHMDQAALSAGYDPDQAWNHPTNLPVGRRNPVPYRCPAHREETRVGELECTDYALVTGPGTVFPTPESGFDFSGITDGTSNTVLAVECSGLQIPWTEPRDVDIGHVHMTINELGPNRGSPSLLSSFHGNRSSESHGAMVLLADGSVRFLSGRTNSDTLHKITTAGGNEPIDEAF